jgi:hypothetical protein
MSDLAAETTPGVEPPAPPARSVLPRLWSGEVPLARAFWEYAILAGSLLNLLTSLLAMAVLTIGDAGLVALGIYLLPIPYNILMVVAVWRSADGYAGPRLWADLARVAVLVWAVAASVL